MAHVEDRWTIPDPDNPRKRVRTDRYGAGLRWRVAWVEPGGKRRAASFPTKDAAQARLEDVGVSRRTGTYIAPDRSAITVGEYATGWLDTQGHLKPSGLERVRGIIDVHIRPQWGNVTLADVSHEDVQEWVSGLSGAPSSVQRVHGVLARMLDSAVRARRVPSNEARGVNLPRRTSREHRYLTVRELGQLLANTGRWVAVVRCLALTGMRVGEVAELRVRDIDLVRRRAQVTRSTTTLAGRRVTGTTKTAAGARSVPLADEVVENIRVLVRGQGRDDLVFLSPKGTQLRKDNLRRAFLAAFERSGLEGTMRVHDLRHTAVSFAVASGASVKSVQRMMGHMSAAVTLDTYAGLFDQDLDDVLDRMGKFLSRHRDGSQRPEGAQDRAA